MDEALLLVKRAVSLALLPPGGPLLLAALGLLMLRARPALGRALAWTGVLLALALSTGWGAWVLTGFAEGGQAAAGAAELRAAMSGPERPQAVVILGGGSRHDERDRPHADNPNRLTLERLMHGAWVASVTGLPVLVSGGAPPGRDTAEARVMRRVLEQQFGIRVRWTEELSLDTGGNARGSAHLLRRDGISRVVLVTHAYHMPRARESFERAGLQVTPAPFGFMSGPIDNPWLALMPSSSGAYASWMASHELVGRLWYRLRGH